MYAILSLSLGGMCPGPPNTFRGTMVNANEAAAVLVRKSRRLRLVLVFIAEGFIKWQESVSLMYYLIPHIGSPFKQRIFFIFQPLNYLTMKSTVLLIIIFSSTVFRATGQHQSDKGKLEVSIGASVPVGNFSKATVGTFKHVSGGAKTGEAIGINYIFSTTNKISFSLNAFGTRNPVNTNELEQAFSSQPFYGFSASSGPPSPPNPSTARYYKNWNFNKASWFTAGLMGGGNLDLPINSWKDFFFNAKAGIGGVVAWSPKLDGSAHTDTSIVIVHQDADAAVGFSFTASLGLAYEYKKGTRLHFDIGYLGTVQMKILDVKSVYGILTGNPPGSQMQESGSSVGDLKQSIGMVNISVGVSFIL